jgi:hypothetical protein
MECLPSVQAHQADALRPSRSKATRHAPVRPRRWFLSELYQTGRAGLNAAAESNIFTVRRPAVDDRIDLGRPLRLERISEEPDRVECQAVAAIEYEGPDDRTVPCTREPPLAPKHRFVRPRHFGIGRPTT